MTHCDPFQLYAFCVTVVPQCVPALHCSSTGLQGCPGTKKENVYFPDWLLSSVCSKAKVESPLNCSVVQVLILFLNTLKKCMESENHDGLNF